MSLSSDRNDNEFTFAFFQDSLLSAIDTFSTSIVVVAQSMNTLSTLDGAVIDCDHRQKSHLVVVNC